MFLHGRVACTVLTTDIHPPLDFSNLGYIPHGGPMTPQSYTRQVVQFTARGPVTLTEEQAVRRYSAIHAETEAASAQWLAQTEDDARRWADSLPEIPEEVIASTTVAHPSAQQEVASGSEASQAPAATQSVSSMLQSFAYDDTRDGFDHFTLG